MIAKLEKYPMKNWAVEGGGKAVQDECTYLVNNYTLTNKRLLEEDKARFYEALKKAHPFLQSSHPDFCMIEFWTDNEDSILNAALAIEHLMAIKIAIA